MEPAAFKAMLHFIYTDTMPELDDTYGLDRLKLICEGKLSVGINVDMVATTLALAEQHGCSLLKAKCVDFIIRTPANLDVVMVVSRPLLLRQLLKAARGSKN
ncbi:hypothetical protein E2562_017283 [Oryza meyeriana var. granulata]|uniref:BPM/SPOP BACK domain-containing protein n=1 Tax=Oryza meyeriana var. granulata TaxID=110450 RepID=A0A6G1EM74_9ORYZ|nr:hypothetical protein E2562_017283 [Oryza meyeriana var. granulata]